MLTHIHFFIGCSEDETAQSILEKSIAFDDPCGERKKQEATFNIVMRYANGKERLSSVLLWGDDFTVSEIIEGDTLYRFWNVDTCYHLFNSSAVYSEEIAKTRRISCEATENYKNYY